MKIFTAEQIRAWDAFTIEHEPIASIDLMERAAKKCVDWIGEIRKLHGYKKERLSYRIKQPLIINLFPFAGITQSQVLWICSQAIQNKF